jgi:hypothetical protein
MNIYRFDDEDEIFLAEIDAKADRRPMKPCTLNPDHPNILLGEEKPLPIVLPSIDVPDVFWTWGSSCVVTERVADLLRASSLTGFDFAPVRITRVKGRSIDYSKLPKLWELKITGWGGMASKESGILLIEARCPECGYSDYGPLEEPEKLIDESAYDGSDFFMVWPLPKYIFVTGRVREFVKHNGLKGSTFIPFNKIDFGYDGFSPGRLSFYMSKERAKELGGPLGID